MEKCCDICGDIGVSEAIIFCLQCQSSREHKYCMRALVKGHLDDWLCEDCEFSSKALSPASSPTRDLPDLSKLADSAEVCDGKVLHAESGNLLNESTKLSIDLEKKVATGNTKYIYAEEATKLPLGATKSLSPSKFISNSSLHQVKIEVDFSSQQDLDLGPSQQLKTERLDNMEISEQQQSQSKKHTDMPPKQVEDQPIIDVPTAAPSTAEDSPNAHTQKQYWKTRAKHSDRLHKYLEEKGKIPVIFHKKDGHPVGKYASAFMKELGMAVKKFAPLKVSSWKKITEEQKQPIFDRLESTFIVDFGTGPNSVKKETDKLMNRRYIDNRHRMHKHYKTLTDLPWEEQLKHVPKEYCNSQADWESMCTMFVSETFKKKSVRNSRNQAKVPYTYRGGSKSLLQYRYDAGDGSRLKDCDTVSNETCHNSEKGGVGESAETVDNDEQVEMDNEDDDCQSLEEVDVTNPVRDQVLENHSGYIHGLKNGLRPPKSTSSDATSCRGTNAGLRDELASTQNKLNSTRTALQSAEDKIRMLEANQKHLEETIQANKHIVEANQWMMMQAFERIASDIAKSLTQQPSSSAAPPPQL